MKEQYELTPFNILTFFYNYLANYMNEVSPNLAGYPLNYKFNKLNPLESDIHLELGSDGKSNASSKRPAIYISRTDANYVVNSFFGGAMKVNAKDSSKDEVFPTTFSITITCICKEYGITELFAQYVHRAIMCAISEISHTLGIKISHQLPRSAPQLKDEATDNYKIVMPIGITFNECIKTITDDLKLKTVIIEKSVTL
jgi:hypothetical protein